MGNHAAQRTALPEKLRTLLIRSVEAGASDLHFIPGHALITRLHGDLTEAPGPSMELEETQQIIQALCPPEASARLDKETDLDFSFELPLEKGCLRFCANIFRAGGELGACLRVIPTEIPSFGWAGFPGDLAERLALLHDGLVFLTAPPARAKPPRWR